MSEILVKKTNTLVNHSISKHVYAIQNVAEVWNVFCVVSIPTLAAEIGRHVIHQVFHKHMFHNPITIIPSVNVHLAKEEIIT